MLALTRDIVERRWGSDDGVGSGEGERVCMENGLLG